MDKVANFTYGYLKEALAKDRPFFIGVAPITPHSQVGKDAGPPLPAHKYNNTRPDAKVPRADNYKPENVHISTVFRFHRLFAFLDCANGGGGGGGGRGRGAGPARRRAGGGGR